MVELMAVVIIISIMVGMAGPSMMNALGDVRARDLTGQVVTLYNSARARATGSGRAQLVRFTATANGNRGGLIAYEGNNSSCNASNWAAIVAAGCAPGTGFCTEQLSPASREFSGERLLLGMRTTGAAGTWTETASDMCYEPTGQTFWRAGASVGTNAIMTAENGGAAGNLRGGFVMRVRRVDTAGTQLSVDRELTVPLGAAARVVL